MVPLMKKAFLPFGLAVLCLQGCAEMPEYSNVDPAARADESRYTVIETDTYACRPKRHLINDDPDLNIIRVNDEKVGNIPFAEYYYRNDSPQRALLKPGIYTVQLEYRLPRYFLFADLKFEGKPGQKIMARSQYVGLNRLEVWLEDTATGKVVSTRVH